MGKQIQVGHTNCDEQEVVLQLAKICPWLSLPRTFPAPIIEPSPLGSLTNKDQIIFPEVLSEVVLDNIVKVLPSSWDGEEDQVARYFVHPRAYAFIEWARCPHVNGTISKGRFYLNTGYENTVPVAQEKLLTRLMNSLMEGVMKRSPYKVIYTLPIYVGAHLAKAVQNETIERIGDLAGPMKSNFRSGSHA